VSRLNEIDEEKIMKISILLFFLCAVGNTANEHLFKQYLQLDHALPNSQMLFSVDDNQNLLVFFPLQFPSDSIPPGSKAYKTLRVLKIRSLKIPNPWNLLFLQQLAGDALYPDMTGPVRIVVNRKRGDRDYLNDSRKQVTNLPTLGKQVQVLEDVLDLRYKGRTSAKISKMSLVVDFLRRGLAILNRELFSDDHDLRRYYAGFEDRARTQETGIWNRAHLAAIQRTHKRP
jgi:hypothetical protein